MQAIALSGKLLAVILLSLMAEQALEPVHAQTTPQPTPTATPADPKASEPSKPTSADSPRFSCQVQNGQYLVMYQPKSQPGKQFPWAAPSNMGGGWSADRRCQEISRRLESYRPDGLLEMRTAVENGYNIICATTEKNPTCRIVLTVPQGQDPVLTRDRVFGNLTTADSGQQTTAVNTYAPRGNQTIPGLDTLPEDLSKILSGTSRPSAVSSSFSGIYLKPFLDPADGGTGTGLSSLNSTNTSPSRRLNPDNFR